MSAKYQSIFLKRLISLKQTFEELGGKVQVFTDEKFPLVFADFQFLMKSQVRQPSYFTIAMMFNQLNHMIMAYRIPGR